LAGVNVHTVTPSPDGRLAVATVRTGYSGARIFGPDIILVEMLTGKVTTILKGDGASVGAVAWAADSRTLAVGDIRPTYAVEDNGHIHLGDALTGTKVGRIGGLNADITAIGFAPDAAALAAGQRDGSIYVLEVPGAKKAAPLPALTQ